MYVLYFLHIYIECVLKKTMTTTVSNIDLFNFLPTIMYSLFIINIIITLGWGCVLGCVCVGVGECVWVSIDGKIHRGGE